MKIISVSNVKGGVAKTTTAATLAAGLNSRGYKVLMIDADPQMNLTLCFIDEPAEDTASLYNIFEKTRKLDEIKIEVKENLDLIPGDFDLCAADSTFMTVPGAYEILLKATKKLKDSYDFVIIDTPPNLGFLSMNAYVASDYVLTPMAADSFSLRAVRLLKNTLDKIDDGLERKVPVIGILLTRYSSRTNAAKLLEEKLTTASELLNTSLFKSRIRQAVLVQESQIAKMDLFDYAAKAPVTKDYDEFITELLERIGK